MSATAAGTGTPRWGMVVDLARCVGCQTCTVACKQEHALPPGTLWRFVADCELGTYPDVRRVFLPMQCMQCAEPPCVPVCPTGASRRRADGIVWIAHEACVGCGACAMACAWRARHLVGSNGAWFAAPTPPERLLSRPDRRGVMTKCTFCMDRIDRGLERGLTPGVDAEATPVCALACIAGAIAFGDLADPASRVSRLAADADVLLPELGTRPAVRYIPSRRDPGDPAANAEDADAPELLPASPQTLWRWPAAANFFLGGLGAGVWVVAAALAGGGESAARATMAWLGPLLVALGFGAVALEAGRPGRGWRVPARLATSPMSREAALGGAFVALAAVERVFPSALLAGLAAVAAAGFVWAQGAILQASRGVAAWSVTAVREVFLTSALVSGLGLHLLVEALAGRTPGTAPAAVSLAALAGGLVAWHRWLAASDEPAFRAATAGLRGGPRAHMLVGLGYVAPLGALVLALAGHGASRALAALAGLLMLAGQALAKHALVVEAGQLRPVSSPAPDQPSARRPRGLCAERQARPT